MLKLLQTIWQFIISFFIKDPYKTANVNRPIRYVKLLSIKDRNAIYMKRLRCKKHYRKVPITYYKF